MSLDSALKEAQASVPECVAIGYVDMATGMLLGVNTVDSHPREVIDLVAAATAEMFQGQSVTTIEKMFRKARGQGEDGVHYFNEMIAFSNNLIHVFIRGKTYNDHATVYVVRSSANVGMVLTKSRMAAPKVEAAL